MFVPASSPSVGRVRKLRLTLLISMTADRGIWDLGFAEAEAFPVGYRGVFRAQAVSSAGPVPTSPFCLLVERATGPLI